MPITMRQLLFVAAVLSGPASKCAAVRHKMDMAAELMFEGTSTVSKVVANDAVSDLITVEAEADSEDESAAAPPDVDGLLQPAFALLAGKIRQAEAAYLAAQQALMNMTTARNRRNNSAKRDAAHGGIEAVWAANDAKITAHEINEAVEKFAQGCKVLFAGVHVFKAMKEPRNLERKQKIELQTATKAAKIAAKVVSSEQLDLTNILAIIDQLNAARREVAELDSRVQSGAAAAIEDVVALVLHLEGQLRARQTSIHAGNALTTLAELNPPDARLVVNSHASSALNSAKDKLDRLLARHTENGNRANARLTEMMSVQTRANNTKARNDMYALVEEIKGINDQRFDAQDLKAAINRVLEMVDEFFDSIGTYQECHVERTVMAAKATKAAFNEGTWAKVKVSVNQLQQIAGIHYFYMAIWDHFMDFHKAIPQDTQDADILAIVAAVDDVMRQVHVWVNEELSSLGPNYRQALEGYFQSAATKNTWCDERFTLAACTTDNNGHQPNGKKCKWIWATTDMQNAGERSFCKQVNTRSQGMPYGKDAETPGLFY